MGIKTTRVLTLLSLILALPLDAQEDAYKAKYKINYGRFTRGDDAKVVDEAWGRLEWFRERMGGELGADFTRHLLSEAEKERAKYPALFQSPSGPERPVALNGTAWTNIGPTTSAFTQNGLTLTKVDSGRLRVILPDTADTTGNTVYVLASGGGLWKTTNFLSATPTWTPLTDFIGSNLSGSAAFGRATSTLFVGAGDPFDLGIGGFMVKSTNGGTSWSSSIQLGTASKVYDIKVDTTQATDIVLVGTNNGLHRSTDAGATYAPVASIPPTMKVWSLARTSTGWLAATESTGASPTGTLYRSTDQGATWTAVAGVLSGAGRITLGQGLPGDAVVYGFAANVGDSAQLDLFRSGDGGATWTPLNITTKAPTNPNADNGTLDLMADQAFYNHMILVDPSDASRNTVYLGGQLGSAKTTNGGTTWTLTSNWLAQYGLPYIHADFHCAAYSNLAGTARLYFGTDGGIFTSTDGGTTWDDTKNKGLVNHLIYALAANPGVPGSALVGLQDNGTRIRSGLTSTFNQVRGGDGFGVGWAQDVTSASAVSLSSYVYNAIRRSTTSPVVDQANWSAFTTGLASAGSSSVYNFVTPIVTPPAGADPTGQTFFTYSKTGVIYQSSATGWSAIGTAGSGGITAGRIVRAVSHGIGVSPTDLQHIAAAGSSGYLMLTANGGGTWTEVFLGAAPATPGLVAGWQGFNSNVAWANNNLLYACSEATAAGAVRVAKSANGGSTWASANGNLPDVPVTKLVVDPGDGTGNTVYAATWLGVYRTTDGGTTWSVFGTGLPQGRATDIWIAPDSSSIRVSTWGRGVWEMVNAPVAGTVNITPATGFFYTGDTATFTGTVNGGGTVTYSTTGGTIGRGPFHRREHVRRLHRHRHQRRRQRPEGHRQHHRGGARPRHLLHPAPERRDSRGPQGHLHRGGLGQRHPHLPVEEGRRRHRRGHQRLLHHPHPRSGRYGLRLHLRGHGQGGHRRLQPRDPHRAGPGRGHHGEQYHGHRHSRRHLWRSWHRGGNPLHGGRRHRQRGRSHHGRLPHPHLGGRPGHHPGGTGCQHRDPGPRHQRWKRRFDGRVRPGHFLWHLRHLLGPRHGFHPGPDLRQPTPDRHLHSLPSAGPLQRQVPERHLEAPAAGLRSRRRGHLQLRRAHREAPHRPLARPERGRRHGPAGPALLLQVLRHHHRDLRPEQRRHRE
ncbi:MAG: hypothetical protein H6P99_3074 [Holophagaceae bacterium]|nr:hypothetical protein [Holophagaceae bacterium]